MCADKLMLLIHLAAACWLHNMFRIIHNQEGDSFHFPLSFPPLTLLSPLLYLSLLLSLVLTFPLSPLTFRCHIPTTPTMPCSRACTCLRTTCTNRGSPCITAANRGSPCIMAANRGSRLASRRSPSPSIAGLSSRTVTPTAT